MVMGAIGRGFRLARASWSVVTQERQLLLLPVLSFAASVAVIAVFALGIFRIGVPESEDDIGTGLYVLAFVFYVVMSFVTIFFNAAVIGAATERLEGRQASLAIGLALARRHIGQIFVWAVITATVGMIFARRPGARRDLRPRAGRSPRHRLERDHVLRGAGAAVRARHGARGDHAVGVDLQGSLG
jgi:hypothetical protein